MFIYRLSRNLNPYSISHGKLFPGIDSSTLCGQEYVLLLAFLFIFIFFRLQSCGDIFDVRMSELMLYFWGMFTR